MTQRYKGEELPTLEENHYSLIHVDVWTGKVLDAKGERPCNVSEVEWVLVFESLEEAVTYAGGVISRLPDVKCSIFDHNRQWVRDVSNKGRPRNPRRKPSYQWWKFWRWTFRPK